MHSELYIATNSIVIDGLVVTAGVAGTRGAIDVDANISVINGIVKNTIVHDITKDYAVRVYEDSAVQSTNLSLQNVLIYDTPSSAIRVDSSIGTVANQNITNVDAGFIGPFSIGNLVWFDVNNNGTFGDAGDVELRTVDYKGGDLNTSIIKTTLGRTIMIQWDETSPRPYSRHNLVQGTKGTLAGFPTRVALEGGVEGNSEEERATKNHHSWAQGEQLQKIYEKYDHPLYQRVGEMAKKMGGHGGMDFMMLFRIVECLRNGEPLDQNVYEGCHWSAVAPLSEKSVAQGGSPQAFPDFTRGKWKTTEPLAILK